MVNKSSSLKIEIFSYNTKLLCVVLFIGIIGMGINDAYAAVPLFDTYVADDPDDADNVLSNGDTVTITFDIPTNATGSGIISQAEINANFSQKINCRKASKN